MLGADIRVFDLRVFGCFRVSAIHMGLTWDQSKSKSTLNLRFCFIGDDDGVEVDVRAACFNMSAGLDKEESGCASCGAIGSTTI